MENEKMNCDIDDGVGFIPQLNKFTLGNESALTNAGNTTHGGSSCEINEFVRFKSFLEKSLTVTREFFLPPERLKFGLVPNRSLLSVLNIEDPGPWLMTLQVAGCPTCSNVLKEDDDLKTIIQTQASLVAEVSFPFMSIVYLSSLFLDSRISAIDCTSLCLFACVVYLMQSCYLSDLN